MNQSPKSKIDELFPRMQGESNNSFAAFCDWLLADCPTIEEMAKKYQNSPTKPPTKSLSTLRGWTHDFKWTERAKVWRSHLLVEREEEYRRQYEENIRPIIAEATVLMAQRAKEMLGHPLIEKQVERSRIINGEEVPLTIIFKPTRWTMRDIPSLLETSVEISKQLVPSEDEVKIKELEAKGYKITKGSDTELALREEQQQLEQLTDEEIFRLYRDEIG